jgi:hypothetical protein
MKENKTKDFQDFIKQDFDIVKDYKNASKEQTPKDNLDAMVDGLIEEWEQYIEQDNCGGTAKEALIGCVQDLKALRSGDNE